MSNDIDTVTLSALGKSVTLGHKDPQSGHLTSSLIRNINADLSDAVRQVERREMERITITVALTVGRDREDNVVMLYARRGATLEKGRLQVAPTGQGRLLDEEELSP